MKILTYIRMSILLCIFLTINIYTRAQNAYVDTISQVPFAFTSELKFIRNDTAQINFRCDNTDEEINILAQSPFYSYKELYGSDLCDVAIAVEEIDTRWSTKDEQPLINNYISCISLSLEDVVINKNENYDLFLIQGKKLGYSYVIRIFRDMEWYKDEKFRETCVFVIVKYKGDLSKRAMHVINSFSHNSGVW